MAFASHQPQRSRGTDQVSHGVVGLGDSFTKTQSAQGNTHLDLFAAHLQKKVGLPVTVADLSDDANTAARLAETLLSDRTSRRPDREPLTPEPIHLRWRGGSRRRERQRG